MKNPSSNAKTVLLVDDDVILRLGLARYLRACGFDVIEAAGAAEAKLVLQRGPKVHILFSDAKLAGESSGFVLAQWVRRYRPQIEVVLSGSLANKCETAVRLCKVTTPGAAQRLLQRLQLRSRRSATAMVRPRVIKRG